MKQHLILALAVVGATAMAEGNALWYNGDWDLVAGLRSQTGGYEAQTFDDFIIFDEVWIVNGVWGNFLIDPPPQLSWPGRSGKACPKVMAERW